jgi:hypothetical protein
MDFCSLFRNLRSLDLWKMNLHSFAFWLAICKKSVANCYTNLFILHIYFERWYSDNLKGVHLFTYLRVLHCDEKDVGPPTASKKHQGWDTHAVQFCQHSPSNKFQCLIFLQTCLLNPCHCVFWWYPNLLSPLLTSSLSNIWPRCGVETLRAAIRPPYPL